jgi:Holliday junction resolvase-like predicted endonuclease
MVVVGHLRDGYKMLALRWREEVGDVDYEG